MIKVFVECRVIIIIFSILYLASLSSCRDYDYNISELSSSKIRFSELPEDVQLFFNNPSNFRYITDDGYEYGFLDLICLDEDNKTFELETKTKLVESWVAYYKIFDWENGITYRVDYGNPSPFVVLGNKLYVQNEFNVLDSGKDFNDLEFTCFTLKSNQ